jgi:uncharacterized protein DUF4019
MMREEGVPMNNRRSALFVLLLLSACSPARDTKAAEAGVADFHRAMDAGQYATIYDASSSDMKAAISRDDFVKLLTGIHAKLGGYRAGQTTNWNDNATTGGHFVTLVRQARFEKGPGTEDFVFRIEEQRPVLAGYHVNSNVLITG